ncbi:helix-turn-helix domain-containing protein [Catenulispora pinisilvae]|uniref:helix-turn-helix domain-containing protein n=1 Tax=Catenulispora pinisilvae TaxID=2705253 RepID=UPI0018916721|nr:helix-turn-helix transcriptional regulator [Catenulispora pinisilvae]
MLEGARVVLTPQERMFATEVERARSAARVSQDWLGQQIRMSRSKVSEICNGRYLPTHDTLLRLVEALAMDRERTFALWRSARHARDTRRDDERNARLAPNASGWDRLPPLPPEIVSLMRAQILAAEDLPYRLPGAKRPSLSTVYVRQDLGQAADDTLTESRPDQGFGNRRGDSAEPAEHGGGSTTEYVAHQAITGSRGVRPPARAVRVALDGDQHLLITGGPGQGKSTLTLRLAADVARAWLDARGQGEPPLVEPAVPLRLPARELATHLDMPLPDALAKSVAAEFGPLLKAEVPAHVLGGRVGGCRWLLLIDAIDEIVDREQQERLLRALSHLATDKSDPIYRVVVTSRPLGGTGLGTLLRAGVARYELQPFDAEALRAFATHWFTAEGGPDSELLSRRFLMQVRQAHLAELMRVPLLATIAAIIFEQHRDRPLPDNRFDLYETYLDYIARRSGPRNRSDSVFQEVRTRLLEHLGVVRLAKTGSLAKAAREWVRQHMPVGLSMDWQADLISYLATAGPMIVRRDDLEFLHHSFADHLAATARARELPASFDAEQDVWKEMLHNAHAGYAIAHSEAVLLHYGHLHPTQANEIVRWLCGNTAGFQLVAARLLAQHLPASRETIDAFLDKVWAWALTTAGLGWKILDAVSKATHHSGLPAWLRALMNEPEAPWRSRVQAAVALCTLFNGIEHEQALALLREATRDYTLDMPHRLMAAQGLAEVDVEQRAHAASGLRALIADKAVDATTLRTAAVALADLGDERRSFAAGTLLAVLADPTTSVSALSMAARGLAEIGPEFEIRAASVLREIAGDRSQAASERQSAALALARLGALHGEEAASLLEKLCNDKNLPLHQRSRAVATLADIGPEYVSHAADILIRILESPVTKKTDIWWIVSDLAELGPSFQDRAATHLRGVLKDPGVYSNARLWTIDTLSKLGVTFHGEAVEEYRRLWADPFAGDYDRCQALANLASLGPGYRDEAAALLIESAIGPTAGAATQVEAARMLSQLDPAFHATAADILRELLIDESLSNRVRISAAIALERLGNRFHGEITDALDAVLARPWLGLSMESTPSNWDDLGPSFRNKSLTALRSILNDASRETYIRTSAARGLSLLDPESQPAIATALCAIICDPSDRWQDLAEVAERLVAFGSEARETAVAAIRTRLSDSETDLDARLDLAQALEALGDGHRDEVAQELRFILMGPAADLDLRVRTGAALASLGPQFHREASNVLGSLIEDTRKASDHWGTLASSLAELGPIQRDKAVSALRAFLSDAAISGREHQHAAVVLGQLGRESRDEAAAVLRQLTSDEDQPADVRVAAAWSLIDLLCSPQQESIACLLDISSDPRQRLTDRCKAAEYLVRSDQQYRPRVVQGLRRALKARNIKPAGVLTAILSLRQLRAITEEEAHFVFAATANDPAATSAERRIAITRIVSSRHHPDETLELLRTLLWDRGAEVWSRIPSRLELAGIGAPLAHDVVSVLDEVLTGEEYDASDRLAALHEMEQLGGAHRKQAAAILREAISNEPTTPLPVFKALAALAGFGGKLRVEACDIADRILSDESRPPRDRLAAAKISANDIEPRRVAVELLIQVMRASRCPRLQVDAASALLELGQTWRAQAVSELRRIVQNIRINGYTRVEAARHLAKWSPPDRDTAADIVDAIAGDPTAAPALRWRAAQSLAVRHRARFRPVALTHLQALATDEGIAVSARIRAAGVMAALDPDRLPTAMGVLRKISSETDYRPAIRIQALATIGYQGRGFVDEAVAGLRRLAHDSAISTVARCNAAMEMGLFHRGCREEAALIMREVIASPGAAVHIRWQAARWLATLSATCRDEALVHLTALSSEPW